MTCSRAAARTPEGGLLDSDNRRLRELLQTIFASRARVKFISGPVGDVCGGPCKTKAHSNFRDADFFGLACAAESTHETHKPVDCGRRAKQRGCERAAA